MHMVELEEQMSTTNALHIQLHKQRKAKPT